MYLFIMQRFLIVVILCLVGTTADLVWGAGSNSQAQSFSSNITVDQLTGGASAVVPLFAPEGRRGIQPNIILAYSSAAGNGPFGYGWFMDLGSISRSTKKGIPAYSSADKFICNLGGKSYELVQVGTNEYRARVEEDMLKFTFNGNYWIIKDRKGTSYYFGSRAGSNIENNGLVFKWRLDKVVDLFNNVYVVDYKTDSSFEVRYVLKAGLDPASADLNDAANFAYVITSYTTMPVSKDYSIDYRSGFAVREKYLTTAVTIRANGNRVRRYQFTYSSSRLTGRSFITRITEYAADNATARTLCNISYSATDPTYHVTVSKVAGDNLWNCQFSGDYDRGHENYGPVAGFDVDMGPLYTKSFGSIAGGPSWSINNKGRLNIVSGQDEACQCWTYVYVKQAKTISLANTVGGEWGIYLNGGTTVSRTSMSLRAGYNLIVLTDYHQHESFSFDLGFDLASQVDYMNSTMAVASNLSGDYNGDGRMDIATFYPTTGNITVSLSNGMAFLPPSTWRSGFGINQTLVMGDFNGDGSTDIAAYDSGAGSLRVATSSTNGWATGTRSFYDKGIWVGSLGQNSEIVTGDFNGDGYTDLVVKKTDSALKVQLWINSRSGGFVADAVQVLPYGDGDYTLMTGDFNADGLTDIYAFKRITGDWIVFENTDGHAMGGVYHTLATFGANRNPVLGDFNGDGRTDIAYYDWPNGKIVYRPVTRQGSLTTYFSSAVEFPVVFSLKDVKTQIQYNDYNGDGLPDVMAYMPEGNTITELAYSYGRIPDLLISIDNTRGGRTDIAYQPSTAFTQKNMPFVIPLVSEVAVSNLHKYGEVYKSKYFYTGGQWDPVARDFMGFEKMTVQDGYGAKVETAFNTCGANVYFRGRPAAVISYDRHGQILSKTLYHWYSKDWLLIYLSNNKFTTSSFVYLADTDQFIYDTATTGRRMSKDFLYRWDTTERFGDLVRIIDYGDVDFVTGDDISDDKLITNITYFNNTSSWVLGLPLTRVITEQSGAVVQQDRFLYNTDNGLLLRNEAWNRLNGADQWVATQYNYDEYGNILSVKDALGRETISVLDPVYKLFVISDMNHLNQVVAREYYGVNESTADGSGIFGQLKLTLDANSQRELRTYDVWGRPRALISPQDSLAYPTTTWEYRQGSMFYVVIARRRITSGQSATLSVYTYYDGLGRIIMTKRNAAEAGKYIASGLVSYDARGAVQSVYPPFFTTVAQMNLDAANSSMPSVQYAYDDQGRVIRISYPDGSYETRLYDSQGITTIDANGHKQRSLLDGRGQIVAREEYTGADGRSAYYPVEEYQLYAATRYAYDAAGRLAQVVDARGNMTHMTYDSLGRKISMTDPDMHNVSYEYDILGQMIKQTDARNVSLGFSYDNLGRLMSKSPYDTVDDRVAYTYDSAPHYGKGRLTGVNYPSGSVVFDYNSVGEETAVSKIIGADAYSVNRAYDALGRLSTLTYPDGKAKAVYGYDSLSGMLNTIRLVGDGDGGIMQDIVTGVTYTANGNLSSVAYGNGAVATYDYDPSTFQLRSQVVKDRNAAVIQSYVYSYDSAGNVVQVLDVVKGVTKSYSYDALNRMVASNDGSGVIQYRYDQLGNLIQRGNLSCRYGEHSAGVHAMTSMSDGTTMTYDVNGNLVVMSNLEKTQYYSYDVYNRLSMVEAVDAGSTTRYPVSTYLYDGDGGRTAKTVYFDKGATSRMTKYVGDIFEITDGIPMDYIFMGQARVAAYNGTQLRWFIEDHLGSISNVLDENATVKERIEYTPWGEVRSYAKYGFDAEADWLYFTGKKLDDETGLVYFGARYYNPRLGRFITADSIVQSPYNPQTLNRYAYCNNNPINLVDPTGHWSLKKAWDSFVDAVRHPFDIKSQWNDLWNQASDPDIVPATSAVLTIASFMFMQPELFWTSAMWTSTSASATSAAFLQTSAGQNLTEWTAKTIYDNMLGMRPGTARIWASIDLGMTSSSMMERAIANVIANPATVRNSSLTDNEIEQLRARGYYAGDEGTFGPSLETKDAFERNNIKGLLRGGRLTGSFQQRTLDVLGLKQLGAQHTSANMLNVSFAPEVNPWRYATWGTCHEATNLSLLQAGISSTITNISPSWDMYATTAVYGIYGGQLGNRIYTGINANNEGN